MSTHYDRKKLSPGFTLIEIIVVISIIMIFAAISVGGFAAMRRTIALDINTDTMVNTLNALRGESQRGTMCSGVRFKVQAQPEKITAPYVNATRTCDLSSPQKTPFTWSQDTAVTSIRSTEVESGVPANENELMVLFAPPRGTMLSPLAGKIITLTSSDGRSRTISINPITNTVNAQKP